MIDHLIAKKNTYHDDFELCEITYEFVKPCRCIIEEVNGKRVLMGYGIGDKVTILEPRRQLLVAITESLDRVPLSDGRWLVEWDSDITTRRVY